MIAPTEKYAPPLNLISSRLIARVSLRNCFFSEAFRLDLSIAFISFNRAINAVAAADSMGEVVAVVFGMVAVIALKGVGVNVNNRQTVIIHIVIFFIVSDLFVSKFSLSKGRHLGVDKCYTTFKKIYMIHTYWIRNS